MIPFMPNVAVIKTVLDRKNAELEEDRQRESDAYWRRFREEEEEEGDEIDDFHDWDSWDEIDEEV